MEILEHNFYDRASGVWLPAYPLAKSAIALNLQIQNPVLREVIRGECWGYGGMGIIKQIKSTTIMLNTDPQPLVNSPAPQRKRMGRPRLSEEKKQFESMSFMANQSEQSILRSIAKSYSYIAPTGKHAGDGSISALNRAIANGELFVLNLEKTISIAIFQKAIAHDFDSVEEYLEAIADGLIKSTQPKIKQAEITSKINKPPRPRRSHKPTSADQVGIVISEEQELSLRAIALKLNLTIPSGKDAGDGSISALNRAIVYQKVSLRRLNQQTLDKLWAIAQSHGFNSVEDFLKTF